MSNITKILDSFGVERSEAQKEFHEEILLVATRITSDINNRKSTPSRTNVSIPMRIWYKGVWEAAVAALEKHKIVLVEATGLLRTRYNECAALIAKLNDHGYNVAYLGCYKRQWRRIREHLPASQQTCRAWPIQSKDFLKDPTDVCDRTIDAAALIEQCYGINIAIISDFNTVANQLHLFRNIQCKLIVVSGHNTKMQGTLEAELLAFRIKGIDV
jgi:hypothetical protein